MRSAAMPRFSSKIPGFILFLILSKKIKTPFGESGSGNAAPAFPKWSFYFLEVLFVENF